MSEISTKEFYTVNCCHEKWMVDSWRKLSRNFESLLIILWFKVVSKSMNTTKSSWLSKGFTHILPMSDYNCKQFNKKKLSDSDALIENSKSRRWRQKGT